MSGSRPATRLSALAFVFALLGYAVSEDETVSIKSLGPSALISSKLSPEQRVEALRVLENRFANANRPGVNEEEEEAIVNEALRSTRPNYRPVG